MGNRGPDPETTLEEMLALFESSGSEPYTSKEVASAVDCAQSTAYKKLQSLVEQERLRTKKVGARARVWWHRTEPTVAETAEVGETERGVPETDAEGEAIFRVLFESAFDAILLADDDGAYVDANPAACELFGLSRDALLGRTAAEFAAEGYNFEREWQKFIDADLDRGLFPLVRPDGDQRIVEFGATHDILPGLHLSILRDVTERREAEAALADERERARQYLRTLSADEVVEVAFRTADDAEPLVALCDRLDCHCELDGLVPRTDGTLLQYVRVADASPETVLDSAAELARVDDCRIIRRGETEATFEIEAAPTLVTTLVAAGATPRRAVAAADGVTVVTEVAAGTELRPVVDAVHETFPSAEFVAKRRLGHSPVTADEFHESLSGQLTDRQHETLRSAHLGGYFEWPRERSAGEIASSMGVADTTWLRHLRRAEGTLAGAYFRAEDRR